MSAENGTDDALVEGYLVRLSGPAWGLSLGLLGGFGLFFSTLVLVLKGGDEVGPHLALLGEYLPFYDVTITGTVIGFCYAFAIGYLVGRLICFVYNRVARP